MNERDQEIPTEPQQPEEQHNGGHRRSQRPSKPLTHRMDARTLQAAYYKAGLLRPELEPPKPSGQHKNNRKTPRTKETLAMHEADPSVMKPEVPGTRPQQFAARNITPVSEAQKCLMYGGTAVGVGTILMFAWKGITKWLG